MTLKFNQFNNCRKANKIQEQVRRCIRGIIEQTVLVESRFAKKDDKKYKNCYTSDLFRMELIEDFLKKIKENPDYNKNTPSYADLVDDWDGYEDQVYVQNNIKSGCITYWEGWVDACWDAAYSKSEYRNLSKEDTIKDILKNRFPRIAQEFGFSIKDSNFFLYRGKYIMKVEFSLPE